MRRRFPPGFCASFSLALTALTLSACQTVGSHQAASSVVRRANLLGERLHGLSAPPRAFSPLRVAPLPDIEVEGIDEILHSPVSADPVLRQAASSWMVEWTTKQAELFEHYLEQMRRYGPLVQRELNARGLPGSLRYLPLVESGYSPAAVSPVGATGLWQLMHPTARDLGLTVNSIVDDRRDPVGSTAAALGYLEGLYEEFGSWFLALAAYNGGPGRVRRALSRSDSSGASEGDERFLEARRYLPRETMEFIPRFLAAAALAEDPGEHGFSVTEQDPMTFDEVTVPDATSLEVVARAAQVPEEGIRQLNPQYLRGYTPAGETRTVRVPAGLGERFERNFASIPPDERLTFYEHVVAQGETFAHIARRYSVPVSELVDTNRQVDPRRLQIGMSVIVPLTNAPIEGC